MSTLFSGISIALQAVLSQQAALAVTNHNVANANTPGYSRQEAIFTAGTAYSVGPGTAGQIGTGVTIAKIKRFNLEFFDGRYRKESAESKRWDAEYSVLNQVEVTLAETGTDSLVTKLDAFWSGWKAVADDPQNIPTRYDLLVRAREVSDAFNWRAEALYQIREDQDLAIKQDAEEINSIASQIARLNVEIRRVFAVGDQPNDLLDQRDVLIDQLSDLTGATASVQENGEAMVSIGGHIIVMGEKSIAVETQINPANNNLVDVVWSDNNQVVDVVRGELKGLLDARDIVIVDQINGLNDLAQAFADRVNQVQMSGYSLDTTWVPTVPPLPAAPYDRSPALYTISGTGGAAMEIRINVEIEGFPARIAASQTLGAAGDSSNAELMSNVQYELNMVGGTVSFNQFYTQQVASLGLEISASEGYAEDHQSVADSMDKIRESESGVNLDEEATKMVKYQRAYEAAARLMTTYDEMLDKVINGMGLVGR